MGFPATLYPLQPAQFSKVAFSLVFTLILAIAIFATLFPCIVIITLPSSASHSWTTFFPNGIVEAVFGIKPTHENPFMNTTLLFLTLSLALSQSDNTFKLEPGFKPLFNGKDLTGWHYKDGPAFDGKTTSSDGRYSAKDGHLVVNPGKGLNQLWTTSEFPKDFHLKLEFRAAVNADSGIFLRKPQLQCRDYLVAGPYKDLKKYKPQDWNEIEVIVKGKVATCTCNGEELKFPNELPMTGPIGLEADRGQMEYRRIRIKELP